MCITTTVVPQVTGGARLPSGALTRAVLIPRFSSIRMRQAATPRDSGVPGMLDSATVHKNKEARANCSFRASDHTVGLGMSVGQFGPQGYPSTSSAPERRMCNFFLRLHPSFGWLSSRPL
mmetsp:Transcript_52253/g.124617  ORF Transcript_52253/g.124617 Transcript_52253/m.124617 type:complete len:120 (+) Transcript_52253:28-387(+)